MMKDGKIVVWVGGFKSSRDGNRQWGEEEKKIS